MKQPEFGIRVAGRRRELGLTQEELAEKCRINVRSIQRIETGKVNPRKSTIKLLSDILNTDQMLIKEKIADLRSFYEHLAIFVIVNTIIYLNAILGNAEEFELHNISVIWAIILLIQATDLFFDRFFGAVWEAHKINKFKTSMNPFSMLKNRFNLKRLYLKPVLIILSVVFMIWYLLIGYHTHLVTISRGEISITIESSKAEFEFSLPGERIPVMNEYAINDYHMESTLGNPFNISGHGIISSSQTINLPDSVSEYRFTINDFDFFLKANNLYQGINTWYLVPNKPLNVNIDHLEQDQ